MRLFSIPDGRVDQKDRSSWLSPPFDIVWLGGVVVGGGNVVVGGRKPNYVSQAWMYVNEQRGLAEQNRLVIEKVAKRILLQRLEYEAEVEQQQQVFARNVNAVLLLEV